MEELNPKDSCPENETEVGDKTKTENNEGDKNLDSVLTMGKSQETKQRLSLDGEISLAAEQGFPGMGEMNGALELESSTLLDLSQFNTLPPELKHEVLKRFPIEIKKAARLVSKEWEIILRDHVKFTPILTIETFAHVCTSEQIFNQMTVTDLILEVNLPKPRPAFVGGKNIHKIHFKKFAIDLNVLYWLFASTSNVEEIRVDYIDVISPRDIKNDPLGLFCYRYSLLPTSFSLCQNLMKFETYVIQRKDLNSRISFDLDCSPLQPCKKLKYINIRSSIHVNIGNVCQLGKSMRRYNLILLYPGTHRYSIVDSFKYSFTTEDFAQISQHFPDLSTIDFAPNLQSEWEMFSNIISDVKNELYPNQNDAVKISSIFHFSKIF